MYLNFIFLDQFLFELSCKKTHTHTHTHTHTYGNTDAHKESDAYPIVAFCKNTTGIALASGSRRSPN